MPEDFVGWSDIERSLSRYLFAAKFVDKKIVLDMGCGAGYGTSRLEKSGSEMVIGLDVSRDALRFANSYYRGIRVHQVQADAQHLPFRDASCDVIVALEVFHHVREWEELLRETSRILREGGFFLCSVPNKSVAMPDGISLPWRSVVKEFAAADLQRLLRAHFGVVTLYGADQRSLRQLAVHKLRIWSWKLLPTWLKTVIATIVIPSLFRRHRRERVIKLGDDWEGMVGKSQRFVPINDCIGYPASLMALAIR